VNATEAEAHVRAALYSVAPDLEGEPLDARARFRDQFDFDSMDFMHYALALHRRLGLDIPESHYPRLQSLAEAVAYVCERTRA
jgi:acyl carrier protein